MMTTSITGTLKDWFPVHGGRIHGKIYGDVRNRWRDGNPVTTSAVDATKSEIKSGGKLVTANSIYQLGEPYQEPEARPAPDGSHDTTQPPESLARIGLMVLEQWSEGYSEIETIDVQELAVKAGALVETVFDPEQHNDEHGAAEFGDVWFLFSDEVNKCRAIPTQDDAKAPEKTDA